MATVSQVTEAAFTGRFEDQMTAGANAAAKAISGLGAAVEATEERVTRAERSAKSWVNSLDPITQAENRAAKAKRDAAAAQKALGEELQAGGERAQQAQRALDTLTAKVQQAETRLTALKTAAADTSNGMSTIVDHSRTLATANDNTATSANRLASQVQNASYQIGDFAVQVASGQSAVTALAQQLPQLLGGFGMVGALAGAAVAIGAVIYRLVDSNKTLAETLSDVGDAMAALDKASSARTANLESEAQKVQALTEYYGRLTQAQLAGEQYDLSKRREELNKSQKSLFTELTGSYSLETGLSPLAANPQLALMSDADQARLSAVNEALGTLKETGNQTREAVSGVIGELLNYANQSETTRSAIMQTVEALRAKIDQIVALGEKNDTLTRAEDAAAAAAKTAGEAVAGFGRQASGATGQTDGLSSSVGRLRANLETLRKASADAASAPAEMLDKARAYYEVVAKGDNQAAAVFKKQQDRASQLDDVVQRQADRVEAARKAELTAQAELMAKEQGRQVGVADLGKIEETLANERQANLTKFRQQYQEAFEYQDKADTQTLKNERDKQAATRATAQARRDAAAAAKAEREELAASLRVYSELRLDGSSKLLLGSDADATALKAIRQAIKGSELDPAVQKAAQKKADDEYDQAVKEQQRESKRITDDIVDYSADRFADLFSENSRGWKGMLDTFEQTAKSTMARIAAQLILQPIIAPIVSGVMGTANDNSFLSGSASGTSSLIASAGGGIGGTASQVAGLSGSISKLSDAASGIGKLFGGNGGFQTGYAGIDKYLNYNLTNTGTAGETAFAQAAGIRAPGLSVGQAAGAGLGIAGGAYGIYQGIQTGGAKGVAQGISGAAGVAGGTATLATGLGAASGAIAAVGAVAPYVAVAALIASYFLSGQKPSDKTGTSTLNFLTGEQDEGGLSGARYDQGNRNEAASIAASGWQIQDTYKDLMGLSQNVPLAYQISVGNRDGIGLRIGDTTQTFERTDEGSQELAKALTKAIIDAGASIASQDVKNVVAASGDDIDTITANLEWYKNTYQAAIKDASGKTSEFQQALDALTTQFDPMIGKAASLGLETEKLTDALDKARQAVIDNRQAQLLALEDSFDQRNAAATGQSNSAAYQMAQFNMAAEQAAQDLYTQLRLVQGLTDEEAVPFQQRLGSTQALEREALQRQLAAAQASNDNALWDRIGSARADTTAEDALWDYNRKATQEWFAATTDGMTDLTLLARTQAEERLAIERSYAEKAEALRQESLQAELSAMQTLASQSQVLTGWLNESALNSETLSPEARLSEAQRQFEAARSAALSAGPGEADLSAVTSAASSLISAGLAVNASSPMQAALEGWVRQSVTSLGAQLDLPAFSDDITSAVARLQAASVAATNDVKVSVDALAAEFRLWRQQMRAAAA
ncbi:hypothetical protein RGI145_19585 [Roseomonas gilardii]|uniref:Bacteriophage tail tape measure N-terminal domain-containing protein n=1 Tax=Roseomonas gilardii TaxID=257708 RepID=A0A1L7ALB9_9PROT|nr:hypothetical protein [Roseomonas gilardii]APT59550.1 hypothetical protein RGI145_19585 [Roseomonas gilardii]